MKPAWNNAYNGNSSHAVATACMRGRCVQVEKRKIDSAKKDCYKRNQRNE